MGGSQRYTKAFGKHRPFCCGRCLVYTGNMNCLPCSTLLIVVPTLGYFVWPASVIWNDYTPAIVMWCALTCMLSLYNLAKAWLTEPGICPTVRVQCEDQQGKLDRIVLNGRQIALAEMRAKFCRDSANCVERFDHFCPWVGNVVGVRNYYYFVMFTMWTSIHSISVGSSALLMGIFSAGDMRTLGIDRLMGIIVGIYCIIITCCVGGLFCFHSSLVSQAQTTNEQIKRTYRRGNPNPNNKGCCMNWKVFFTQPIRPSYVHPSYDHGQSMEAEYDVEAQEKEALRPGVDEEEAPLAGPSDGLTQRTP